MNHHGVPPLLRFTCLGLALLLPPLSVHAEDSDISAEPAPSLLAMRLPDLPLPDLGDLARLPLPLPRPEDIQINVWWHLPFQTLGFKGGTMYAPFDHSTRSALGLVTSGRFNINPLAMFSLEMEIMGTNSLLPGGDSGADTWSASTFGLYAAFRFGDPVFFKVRTGWMGSNMYVASGVQDGVNTSTSSIPIGVGIGWRVGPRIIMETEITWAHQDLSILSFGILF